MFYLDQSTYYDGSETFFVWILKNKNIIFMTKLVLHATIYVAI